MGLWGFVRNIRRDIFQHHYYSDRVRRNAQTVRDMIASGYNPRRDPESPYYDPKYPPLKNPKPSGVDYGDTKFSLVEMNDYLRGRERMEKRGAKISKLDEVVKMLLDGQKLPSKYNPHKLHGDMSGLWECHIKGGWKRDNWVLLYTYDYDELILYALDTGTHEDCTID